MCTKTDEHETEKPLQFKFTVMQSDPLTACEVLASRSGLSKGRIKDAMIKGAAWRKPVRGKMRRIRRAKAAVRPGDMLALYYNQTIINLHPPAARCLKDNRQYSIWYKPAGLMTQGTRFGDHCALSRQVEQNVGPSRSVYLVHRIDREASGLVILAHSRSAAGRFSALLRHQGIEKHYQIRVRGDLFQRQPAEPIDIPLGGKPAVTVYEIIGYDPSQNQSLVHVQLHTGRFHQIRRHFDMIGFPVMGDPRYGAGNKNRKGMQLIAFALRFQCPCGLGEVHIEIDPDNPESTQ